MRIKRGTPLSSYLDAQQAASEAEGSGKYYLPAANLATECVLLRDEQGLTQAGLAQRMGTKQPVISRFENLDGRLPSYDFIVRLSLAFGYTPAMTLQGDFTAVVPPDQRTFVKELADHEGVSTRLFVESLLDWAISRYQAKENHVVAFADATDSRLPESLKAAPAVKPEVRSQEELPDFAKAV